MEIIIHRVNKIKELNKISTNFGAEIDIRTNGSNLILGHDPFLKGDKLKDYLENYNHKTLVLNIKEAGIEEKVLSLVKKYSIKSYFLLDVEMPYLYKATIKGQKNIAVRFSEYENIFLAKYFKNKLKWVWIDTVTMLPVTNNNKNILNKFKSCIVCPERWGRKKDIKVYKEKLKRIKFKPTAIMTSKKCANNWLE
ncbi:hypothetical protein N9D60_00810 [Candidatus Pelagibacter sp.]|nr:hypothetical protein [Candidatus Pelagibacter sp.]